VRARPGRSRTARYVGAGGGQAWADLPDEELGQLAGCRGDEAPGRVALVDRGGVAGVGQPLQPLPVRKCVGWDRGQDLDVVGGVEGGELAEHGAGERARPVGRTGDGQDAEMAQGDGHRGVGEPLGSGDELLGRLQELGVVLGQWAGRGVQSQPGGQGDGAPTDAVGEEVVVAGAALPQPVGPVDQRPEPGQVGVQVLGRCQLVRRPLPGLGRHAGEMGQVAVPLATAGPAGGAALDQAEPKAQRHRDDRHPGHGGDQPDGTRAGDGEQEDDRPAASEQRHQVLQPAGEAEAGPADGRRGRHHQLVRRRRSRVDTGRPVHRGP
jgi:hypothetical protein